MKKLSLLITFCLFFALGNNLFAEDKVINIVILGSSTAAGSGPKNAANGWVNQYRQYVQSINANSTVTNLAIGGYTTYHVMPSDYTAPDGRPAPDENHNITKALSLNPDVIIINLPTNDAAKGYTVEEQLFNYLKLAQLAYSRSIPVYITTTQPRNISAELRQNLMDVRDSISRNLGNKCIDFWTDIANEDGTVNSKYDSGDGVHLNDDAHTLLKNRVVSTDILDYSRIYSNIDTINIDFGTTLSGKGWNNFQSATKETKLYLINSQNQNTGISAWVHDPFTGVNTTGTSTPAENLKLPSSATSDSFFGSVEPHSGVSEPTGGLTLAGLNRNSLYSLSFFASRTGVSDNRETAYQVVGESIDTLYLDPANNTENIVTVENIKPSSEGTIIINVAPGPNNTNSSKYYFIGAIKIVSERQEVECDEDGTVFIDFGSKNSSGYWNNMTSATGGEVLSDLINKEGNSSCISLWVHDAFTGINETGTTNPDATLGYGSNATSDSFFGNTFVHSGVIEPTAGVTLSNLDLASVYTLTFFASRDGANDNREAQYKVSGNTSEITTLDASNNTSKTAVVSKMKPSVDGTIIIDVSAGANNNNGTQYYYLGVMQIDYQKGVIDEEEDEEEEEEEVGFLEKALNNGKKLINKIYPIPSNNLLTIEYSVPINGNVQIEILNLMGNLQYQLLDEYLLKGKHTIRWRHDSALKSGAYICKIHVKSGNIVLEDRSRIIIVTE